MGKDEEKSEARALWRRAGRGCGEGGLASVGS